MLLLFDYDGVIVDSFVPLLELCVEAQRNLGHGRPPSPGDFRTIRNLTFDDLGRLIGIPEVRIADYSETIFELQKARWHVSPFPDIVSVLRKLATRHTLAVITASQGETVKATLEAFGLGSAISTTMGGESGTSKPERIAMAQAKYSAGPETTFMIGDAISDIRAGKQAGVRTVAVSWGFQDRELLTREEPDFILDHPEDLLSLVSPIATAANGVAGKAPAA